MTSEQQTRGIEMNAIPYDRPEEEWDSYPEGTEEQDFESPRASSSAVVQQEERGAVRGRARSGRLLRRHTRREEPAVELELYVWGARNRRWRGSASCGGRADRRRRCDRRRWNRRERNRRRFARRRERWRDPQPVRWRCRRLCRRRRWRGATFGTVSSISGNSLYITEASGNTVKVTLSSATKVTKNVGVGKKAVRPGDTVVVAGAKNFEWHRRGDNAQRHGCGSRWRHGWHRLEQ